MLVMLFMSVWHRVYLHVGVLRGRGGDSRQEPFEPEQCRTADQVRPTNQLTDAMLAKTLVCSLLTLLIGFILTRRCFIGTKTRCKVASRIHSQRWHRDVIYALPLVISSSCHGSIWTDVAFGHCLYSVRDYGTLCLDCCVTLATTLLALAILWRHSFSQEY